MISIKRLIILFLCFFVWQVNAARLTETGFLRDSIGKPVNGSITLVYRLYATSSGGFTLWRSDTITTSANNGVYSVTFGNSPSAIEQAMVPPTANFYLEKTVNGQALPRYLMTDVIKAAYASKAVESDTAKRLNSMSISQFVNDMGFMTTANESDPTVKGYAKTKLEGQLQVGTANVALVAHAVTWSAINGKPLEYLPVSGSAYYKAGNWVPSWSQIIGIPDALSYLGSRIEAAEIADGAITDAKIVTINGQKIVGTVLPGSHASAHQLGGVDQLMLDMSQITGLIATLNAKAGTVSQVGGYSQTVVSGSNVVGVVGFAVTANVALEAFHSQSAMFADAVNWAGINNKPLEMMPTSGSVYYKPADWQPLTSNVMGLLDELNAKSNIGHKHGDSDLAMISGSKVMGPVGLAATANVALSAQSVSWDAIINKPAMLSFLGVNIETAEIAKNIFEGS